MTYMDLLQSLASKMLEILKGLLYWFLGGAPELLVGSV
jgi:hypothetical protein